MSTARLAALALATSLFWPLLTASSPAAGPASPAAAPATASPPGFAAPACVPALAAGSHTLSLDVDGWPREAIVHVPAMATGSRPPAVIAFHGYTAYADQLEVTSGLSRLADEAGFVVAYPQALGSPTEWHFEGNLGSDERDIAMVKVLMTELTEEACADPARVVLAGHSQGGGMASDAACRLADRVAGVALVAAVWFEPPCQPARAIPVVAMHALDDPVLPYAGGPIGGVAGHVPQVLPVEEAIGAWAARDGCGSTPQVVDQTRRLGHPGLA